MKELPLGFDTAVVTSFGSCFHSESDCHGIFHVEKFGTSKLNISRTRTGILQMVNGAYFLFLGSFISDQLSLW